jgi:predicted NBD/HSP70 family sugar kinase
LLCILNNGIFCTFKENSMTERLYAVSDIGATNARAAVYTADMELVGRTDSLTDPNNYHGTVQTVADHVEQIADGQAITSASTAVAAEVIGGVLTRAGDLHSWIGNNLVVDMAAALNLPEGRVGVNNDVVVIAISQQAINAFNRQSRDGIVVTLSSGFGGALQEGDGKTTHGREPGHEFLRSGAICPCGGDGHVEAYISGKGVLRNLGTRMEDWLSAPTSQEQLALDVSATFIDMIEREREDGFNAEEFRWTGAVALGQPVIMWRASNRIQAYFGPKRTPMLDTVTMGDQAGLHGAFMDAKRLAAQY